MDEEPVAYGEGPFQYMVAFSAFAATTVFLTHAFSFRITARSMDHWCRPPDYLSNMTDASWKEMAIPKDDTGTHQSCTVLDPPNIADPLAVPIPCSSWHFDLEEYGNTIVSQWSLVCQRQWLVMLAVALYSTSPILGLPIMGMAADTYGRKTVIYVALPVVVVAAAASSMTRSFAVFVLTRVVVSVTSTSILVIVFALLFEVSSGNRRVEYWLVSTALAYVSLPVVFFVANSLKLDWDEFYRWLAALTCGLLLFYFTVDESPRWLLVKWKVHKAERVALRAARLNGVHARDCLGKLDTGGAELPKVEAGLRRRIFVICGYHLRRRTILLSFVWLVFTAAYNVVNLTRIISPSAVVSAINIILIAPAQLLLYPVVRLLGVKRTAIAISAVFTLSTLVLALMYREERPVYPAVLLIVMRVLLEMFSLVISIITVAAFPTTTRCWGSSVIFALGRLGSFMGFVYSTYEGDHRKDIVLCALAACMIFVCGAIECMPEDADDRSWQVSSARSSVSFPGTSVLTAKTDSSIRSLREQAMTALHGRSTSFSAHSDTPSGLSRAPAIALLEVPRVRSARMIRKQARRSDGNIGHPPSEGHRVSQGFSLTSQHDQP
ncbi:solute carrier family 22 member 7 [Rhipicephalus microplus]|uniref:solute carrier family 22 member 7 n=1 Tax=Rhipicephalus microplus TaxID=6941 RepID=UPI003F6AF023